MERRYHLHTNPYLTSNPYLHSGSRYSGAKSPGTARSSSSWVLWEPQSTPSNHNPWCSLLTILILFLVILGVLAVAGLALYMGALRLEPVQSFLVFDGSMRVTGDRYSTSLANKSSNFYLEKERRYQTLLEAVFMKSPLGSSVHEIYVTSFANGSLIVFFRIILDRKKIPKPISSIEDTLKSVILQEASSPLSVMNALRIDPKELIIKRFLEDTKHIVAKEELSTSHPLVSKEPELLETQRPAKNTDSSSASYWPVTVSGEASVKTLPSQMIQGTYTVTNGNTQMVAGKPRPATATVVKEETAIVTPTLVLPARRTTVQRSTTEPPELLFAMKHSPALKQYLSLNKEASTATSTASTTTTISTTTTTTTPKPTTTSTPTTTTLPTTTTTNEPSKLYYSDEPWKPIFPDTERRDFKDKLDFDYGVGEAEVVLDTYADASQPHLSEEQVKVTSRMKPNTHTLPSNLADEVYYTPASPKLSPQVDVAKSMPELSIVQQFHNLDALLRSYTAKPKTPKDRAETVATLLPVRSNVGVRSELRPRPTVSDSAHSTTTETISTSSETMRRIFHTPESDLVSIPLQKFFSVTSPIARTPTHQSDLAYVTENLKGLAVIGQDHTDVSSQRAASSPDRRSRTTPTSSRKGRSGPLDDEMKLLLERIFQNLTTTAKNPSDNRSHKIDFHVPTHPAFNINNTHFLNKIAKLQIANMTVDSEGKVYDKAVTSSIHSSNAAPFRLLTKIYNKATSKDDSKQDLSKESTDCGEASKMLCGSGECLPTHFRCNKLMDCRDGSDETNCTCADFLRNQYHSGKICDGIYDCWDLTDEQNCEWCSPGQHICANSKMCVDASQVCDGFPHCPYGDDEKNCITVAPTLAEANEKDYFPSGYVMIRKEGDWGKMCLQNFDNLISKSKTHWSLEDLGKSVCRSLTYKNFDGISRKKEISGRSEMGSPVYYELTLSSEKNSESPDRRSSSEKFTFQKTTCIEKEVAEVLCSDLECGIRPEASVPWANERRSRIVGGGNAGPGAWPWQAALYKEGEFQCGATLISDTWLLSAGHCFYKAQKDFWVARLGALRRGTVPAPFEQLRPIAQVVLHPEYQDQGFINDISLLRMVRPVTFTTYVRPICLPSAGREPRHGAMCTVVGWGQLYEIARVFPDTLQEVQLPIISTSECRKRTLFLPLYKVTDNMFCAGYERGGRDACLGDSGGPLMCQENDGRWVLNGVTSNGYGCARANRPGVYTKVVNYLPWVESVIASPLGTDEDSADCAGHRCPLGECLSPARLCNGYIECHDSSDERGCW